jgi:hypothetical protein
VSSPAPIRTHTCCLNGKPSSSSRPVALARGAIPWTSIDRYAARHGIEADGYDRFCRLIRAMDAAYLTYLKDKPPDAKP